jgi:uncharacterized protein (DUF1800 family)
VDVSKATLRLTRRQALGFAVGGAAGAAGLAAVGGHLLGAKPAALAAGSGGSWSSPLGTSRGLAAHLLRRAGFAYTSAELDSAAGMKYADLVEMVVNQVAHPMPAPSNLSSYTAVSQSWLQQMSTTPAQFPERMALFWHGHLTSDYRKAAQLPFVYFQNELYRNEGTGNLRTLLNKTTTDPLMMRYLDLDQSSASAPNENYSRELMELFTLGVGNYTETDVREAARALSGLRIMIYDKNGNRVPAPKRGTGTNALQQYYAAIAKLAEAGAVWKGVLVPKQHDQGSKTYLGHTGNLSPGDVIDIILAQDACAPFITKAALTYFAVPSPSAATVNSIAVQFRASGYDIKTLMRAIFTSGDFTAPGNYRSLVRSPTDYMVATMRVLGNTNLANIAVKSGAGMDQVLYDPPTVAGWPENGAWLSSASMLARLNFAAAAVAGTASFPAAADAIATHLDNVVGPDLANVYNASTSEGDRWYAVLGSPEFQLK